MSDSNSSAIPSKLTSPDTAHLISPTAPPDASFPTGFHRDRADPPIAVTAMLATGTESSRVPRRDGRAQPSPADTHPCPPNYRAPRPPSHHRRDGQEPCEPSTAALQYASRHSSPVPCRQEGRAHDPIPNIAAAHSCGDPALTVHSVAAGGHRLLRQEASRLSA